MARVYGLIGRKLSHSFSQTYFSAKFDQEKLTDCIYKLFELNRIEELIDLINREKDLMGLNITIPYKQEILPYLDDIDERAARIGAVNVVRIGSSCKLTGYNSDYYGFRSSLINWIDPSRLDRMNALVLGSGGASLAVNVVLEDLGMDSKIVSRTPDKGNFTYHDLNGDIMAGHQLIINTTPLGMFPDVDQMPDIPYSHLSSQHYLYDLVYNPELTKFLQLGLKKGVQVKNGLDMLHRQAEKSWEIWNS